MSMLYSEKVMDHFTNPRNVGEIENADGIGEIGNAKCGDIMKAVIEALGGLPAVKVHCSVLAEEAVKAALADYYKKQGIDHPVIAEAAACAACDHDHEHEHHTDEE